MSIIVTIPRSRSLYERTVLEDSPTAYWRLNEGSGTAVDKLGNNSGTYNGDGSAVSGLIANDSNKAYEPNTNGYVNIPVDGSLDLTFPFSVEFWCQHTTGSNTVILDNGDNSGFSSQTGITGAIKLSVGGTTAEIISNLAINDGDIHHVVFLVRGVNNGDVYIDNVDRTASTDPATPSYGAGIYIGSRGGNFAYPGVVDEVAFYDFELGLSRIQRHYNVGIGA